MPDDRDAQETDPTEDEPEEVLLDPPSDAEHMALAARQMMSDGPPFGMVFFATILPERVQVACPASSTEVAVVLLHLMDGAVLDLCHVVMASPQWLAAAVFGAARRCDEMDTVFVPYRMIARVTITRRPGGSGQMGFQVSRSRAALQAEGGAGPS